MRCPPYVPVLVVATAGVALVLALGPVSDRDLPDGIWGEMEEARQSNDLDRKREFIGQCIRAKEAIAGELVRDRLTLLEAAARAREIDRRNPYFLWDIFREGESPAYDAERHCREIIKCLRTVVPDGPEQDRLVARYRAELRTHLDRGTLYLPEPPRTE